MVARPQRRRNFAQEAINPVLLDLIDALAIHSGCASVGLHSPPRLLQDVIPENLAVQRAETPTRCPLGCGPELSLQLTLFGAGLRPREG